MSLPVTLTPGNIGLVCYPDDPQTLADAIINAASGQLEFEIGGIVYKNIDDGEPDPAYRGTALWFETKNRQFFWWSTTLAKWVLVHDPALYNVTAGTGLAYTLDLTAWSFESIAALTGFPIVIKAHAANTGAATLQVDTFAATAIKQYISTGLADLSAGNIVENGVYVVVYDGTNFVLLNPTPIPTAVSASGPVFITPVTAFTGTVQDWTTYSTLATTLTGKSAVIITFDADGDAGATVVLQMRSELGSTEFTMSTLFMGDANHIMQQVIAPLNATGSFDYKVSDTGGGTVNSVTIKVIGYFG